MNRDSKIELTDTPMSAMVKVADGNPGAVTVLMRLFAINPQVDPQDIMGGLGPIMTLDSHGIYGSDIWEFWKVMCKCDYVHVLSCMRAVQLGFLAEATLLHAIRNNGEGVDIEEMYNKVKERLPQFNS